MKILFESVILYVVLFLSGSIGMSGNEPEYIIFSVSGSLTRIALYNIPALALIWYLALRDTEKKERLLKLRPVRGDIFSFAFAFPGLVLVGFTIALLTPLFPNIPAGPAIVPPSGILSWFVLFLSCISTGYLEESFFRFYLLSKRREMGLGEMQAAFLSTLLFSLCHVYEGPWGFLNSALSGFLLAYIFLRYNSIHGIALAHGLYNLMVFALSGL